MIARVERLLRRWEMDVRADASRSFEQEVAALNLRRLELGCVMLLAINLITIALGLALPVIVVEVPAALLVLVLARRCRRSSALRLQQALVYGAIVAGLAAGQWTTYSYSGGGPVPSGYVVMLLSIALLLVLPPRAFAAIVFLFFLSFIAILPHLPVTDVQRLASGWRTAVTSVIAIVGAMLIYRARRQSFEQEALIRAQNRRLAEQNREMDELMAVTAHDLRSPLYGLRNLFGLALRRAEEEPAVLRRAVADGIFSLDAMLALVSRLLEAHSVEHRPLAAPVAEDLRSQLIAAARRNGPAAMAAHLAIELELPDGPLIVRSDFGAMGQILDNLLANAIRHSPADGAVVLGCGPDLQGARLWVRDFGPGIDPLLAPILFEKFGGGSGSGGKPGTGMGLFIAATLAHRIDARLTHQDAEPGACFQLVVPFDLAADRART